MKLKKREMIGFTVLTLLSTCTLGGAIAGASGLLDNNLTPAVEAGIPYDCTLTWDASCDLVKVNDGFTSLSVSQTTQLKYGTKVTKENKAAHAELNFGDISQNYISTSGLLYENGLGGVINGIHSITIDFDSTVDNLTLESWNSTVDRTNCVTKNIDASGTYYVGFTTSSLRPNEFRITRNESDGRLKDEPLAINKIVITATAVQEPADPGTIKVFDQYDLIEALKATGEHAPRKIILQQDIIMNNPTTPGSGLRPDVIVTNPDLIIDLNGKTIKRAFTTESINGVPVFMALTENADVTIIDNENLGGFDAELGDSSSYAINVNSTNAILSILGGRYLGAPTGIQVQAGTLNVFGGHFDMSASCKAAAPQLANYEINCIDKAFKNGTAKINVYGGEFVGFNPDDNPEGPNTSYLVEGATASNAANKDIYVVTSDYRPVTTASDLKLALDPANLAVKNIVLAANIRSDHIEGTSGHLSPIFSIKKPINLDLAGHDISVKPAATVTGVPVIMTIESPVDVVIDDSNTFKTGTFDTELGDSSCYAINVNNVDATLTIKDGNYLGAPTGIQVQAGSLNVFGGHFDLAPSCKATAPQLANYEINCIDKAFKNGTAKINVYGGEFVGFNPSANPEGVNTSYVNQYATVTKDEANDTYTVNSDFFIANNAAELKSALSTEKADIKHVILGRDIALDHIDGEPKHLTSIIEIQHDVIIDLNGFEIGVNPAASVIGVPALLNIKEAIEVVIKDSSYNNFGSVNAELGDSSCYAINVNNVNATLTIDGGTYLGAPTGIQVQAGTLNVFGGHFDLAPSCKVAAPQLANYEINCIDNAFKNGTAKINVYGGEFVGFNPSANPEGANTSYLVEGATATFDEKTNTYIVKSGYELAFTEKDLAKALEKDNKEIDHIVLADDIVCQYVEKNGGLTPIYNIYKDLTIDLAGKELSMTQPTGSVNGVPVFFSIMNPVDVVVKDSSGTNAGTLNAELGDSSSYCMNINNVGATLTIDGGTYLGAPTGIQVQAGTLNVIDGHFDMAASCKAAAPQLANYEINCIDKAFKNGTAKINVYGGEFVAFDPSANPEGANTSYVNVTSVVNKAEDSDTYVATSEYKCVKTESDLRKALAKENSSVNKIVLIDDIELDAISGESGHLHPIIDIKKDVTIDLNGHRIGLEQVATMTGVPALLNIVEAVNVTINDSSKNNSGVIDAELGDSSCYAVNVNNQEATLTINGGTFLGAPTGIQVQAGTLNVKGGHFDLAKSCKVAAPELANYEINCIDSSYEAGTAIINVSGGEFVNFDPSANPEGTNTSYVLEGFQVGLNETEGGEKVYFVVPNPLPTEFIPVTK